MTSNAGVLDVGVIAVDDNPLMVDSLERMVKSTPGLRWECGLTGGEGVIDAVQEREPALVLMDMQMPGVDTCKLVTDIATRFPNTRVLMLSGHLKREYVLGSIDAGALGYVGKHRDPDYITEAIRKVAAGEFFVCPDAAAAAGLA
ncbi:MAG TPA: response regulator transcription factor [Phycisphaerales bacterium]|nr:response regulator transcription factor [Phycisphaerales bacterium]